MNLDQFLFFFFSFFLLLCINHLVGMVRKKEVKSKKFALLSMATIVFIVNIYIRIGSVFN